MERIVFNDGTSFDCPAQVKAPIFKISRDREWNTFTILSTAGAAAAAFVNGAEYRHEWDSTVIAEDGTESTEIYSNDLSEYCIAGEIVDHRDGTVTVYMGKKTETELMQERIDEQETALNILFGEEE